MPSGRFLMEDFYYAGGLLALMARIAGHLDLDQQTVTGQTWRDILAAFLCTLCGRRPPRWP